MFVTTKGVDMINPSMTYKDMFDIIIPRLTAEPPVWDFLSTLSNVVDFIDRRLLDNESELITNKYADSLGVNSDTVYLQPSFLALRSNPTMSYGGGYSYKLTPLPKDMEDDEEKTGRPEYFSVRRNSIVVYPSPDKISTVRYTTYEKTVIGGLEDECPYGGLFNDQIIELLVKFGSNPVVVVSPLIDAYLANAIDRVLAYRSPKYVTWKYAP